MHTLIPAPADVTAGTGPDFVLDGETTLDAGPDTEGTARWLRGVLAAATGCPLLPPAPGRPGTVRLRTEPGELAPEAYRLTVRAEAVELTGGGPEGVFHGAQTLRQLLGPAAHRRAPAGDVRRVAPVEVRDAPRFRWRGLMLDVARHFMPKDGVLRWIDLLAAHKLNVLHLHLTDDQGWRLEIERRPRLTETGAWRPRTKAGHRASKTWDERPHGGYYTHADIREIVAYAAARHVTVVPEIEMPGHSQAAVAAYPWLGNTDVPGSRPPEVWTDWGISPRVLAPNDATLRFYEDVLDEVLELFPSPFVHLGGDECPKDEWRASPAAQARMRAEGLREEAELQLWFLRHFDRWLAGRGRRLVGWDEVLDGGSGDSLPTAPRPGLTDGAVISSWRGRSGGIAAARAGHDVIMCPAQQVYLDYRQDAGEHEPVPIGYVRTLDDVYRFEPVPPELAGSPAEKHVLGAQANMWTEATETPQRVDYQAFPRLAALAEVFWSPLPAPEQRDFADFERRMRDGHYARLDAMGVDYRPPGGPRPWQRRPGLPGHPIEGAPPVV